MPNEVRSIPPAPRRVRLRPLLAHRWPLLAVSALMVVMGSLIAWAMFLQSGGKFSLGPALDEGPTLLANGVADEVALIAKAAIIIAAVYVQQIGKG